MSAEHSIPTNEELCVLIKGGNYDYFPELIGRLMPHIKATALKWKSVISDTDDLISEGVIAVFNAVKTFDSAKASFATFAGICIDRAIGGRVKAELSGKRIPGNMLVSIDEGMLPCESTEELVIRREENDLFNKGINECLTALERKVLAGYLEGGAYADIAADLGVSVKSVDSALQRIRAKLRK